MPGEPQVQVEFTPEFKRNLRALARKYRHIRSDIEPVIEQLVSGQFVGEGDISPQQIRRIVAESAGDQ